MSMIEDGTGTGSRVKVDSENKLRVRSTSASEFLHLTNEGRAFYVDTGFIDLTSSSASAVLFFENQGQGNFIINGFDVEMGLSQELTGTPNPISTVDLEIVSGITGDDLTSDIIPLPMKSSSAISISGEFQSGSEGKTFTGGQVISRSLLQHGARHRISAAPSAYWIGKDQNLGIRLTPPSGTSSGNDKLRVKVSFFVYVEDTEVGGF